ncbi:MAG: hypothetical protein WD904_08100 [Dehalococcoidia bacterium]
MQFGSVFKMKPKAGKKQELVDLFKGGRPTSDVKGFVMAHVFDCGDEVWGVAVFASEQAYRDNANDPAQDKEYRQMRDLLEADPEWHDGTIESIGA